MYHWSSSSFASKYVIFLSQFHVYKPDILHKDEKKIIILTKEETHAATLLYKSPFTWFAFGSPMHLNECGKASNYSIKLRPEEVQ